MTNTLYGYPASYDSAFIRFKSETIYHSTRPDPNDPTITLMSFDEGKFDAVAEIVRNYPTLYMEVERPKALARASATRDRLISGFKFGGLTIRLDLETKANITGAVSGLERDETITALTWSLGDGAFVKLPRDTVFQMGKAAFAHVQRCFDAHEAVAALIMATKDIHELAAVEIETNEAWSLA